jgi:hypothetical protein
MKQLSIAQCSGYPTYLNTNYGREENLADHKSFISSLNILLSKENDDISCLYWITKFHNNLNRGNNITGAYSFSRQQFHCCQRRNVMILEKVYSRSSLTFKSNVDTGTLDLLDNFNYRSIWEISLCPNMWLLYTLQTMHRGYV